MKAAILFSAPRSALLRRGGGPRRDRAACGGRSAWRLDVVAVDDSGRPVQGLRQDQFHVKENGRAVTIDSFTERAALGAFGRADARSVVLVLDDTGIPPQLTTTVQKIARQFIDRMGQDDRSASSGSPQRSDEAVGDRSIALVAHRRATAAAWFRTSAARRSRTP